MASDIFQWPAWLNGKAAIHLPLYDRGFSYGDGLFETISVVNGTLRLGQFHLDRLFEGCLRLNITVSRSDIETQFDQPLAWLEKHHHKNAILKLTVTRGAGGRG